MEMSGQLHAPAALPAVKEPTILIEEEDGWALERVWTLWNKENSIDRDRNRTLAVSYPHPTANLLRDMGDVH
jgi:hypothetical protein